MRVLYVYDAVATCTIVFVDGRQVAARTLGDIVKKLGEKVLPEIIPILQRGLTSDDAAQRQGVCIGLSEIMSCTSREHVSQPSHRRRHHTVDDATMSTLRCYTYFALLC